ncbi:MAG TPA: hypothetical protein VHM02_14910, partial [Thermoanaerobaculia bacterium]|nr:hypothetical protein [Thermoanaerobaculia bacterium]
RPWLERAGIDPAAVREVAPAWRPPVYADRAVSFEAPAGEAGVVRVEAASFGGRPVWFEVVEPGARPRHVPAGDGAETTVFFWLIGLFYVVVAVLAVVLARRNLRLGRGDRRGALRVAAFVFVVDFLGWAIAAPHSASLVELLSLLEGAAFSTLAAMLVYLAYLALEPIVRRRWPQRLVSWTRLLSGDLADPMVGRDVLWGVLAGAAMGAVALGRNAAASASLGSPVPLHAASPPTFEGWRGLLLQLSGTVVSALVVALTSTVFVVLLYAVLRRRWLAALAFWLLFSLVLVVGNVPAPATVVLSAAAAGIWTLALVRGGLLTMAVTHAVFFFGLYFPWTLDPGAWYLRATVVAAGLTVALAVYGAVVAAGGRHALAGWLPEEG